MSKKKTLLTRQKVHRNQ